MNKMNFGRWRRALLAGAGLFLLAGVPAFPQQPPPGKPTPKEVQEAREKKAADLWAEAEGLEKNGKFFEAQGKLRELRSRYRGTSFYFSKMIEISDKINELGIKVAAATLQKTTMYKRPHQDSWYGYEFVPPLDWKGVPPAANWFGDYDNSEVDYKGQTIRISRYTAPYLDKLYLQVFKTYAMTSIDTLKTSVTNYVEERYGWKRPTEQEIKPSNE